MKRQNYNWVLENKSRKCKANITLFDSLFLPLSAYLSVLFFTLSLHCSSLLLTWYLGCKIFMSHHCERKGKETELDRGRSLWVTPNHASTNLTGGSGASMSHQSCPVSLKWGIFTPPPCSGTGFGLPHKRREGHDFFRKRKLQVHVAEQALIGDCLLPLNC